MVPWQAGALDILVVLHIVHQLARALPIPALVLAHALLCGHCCFSCGPPNRAALWFPTASKTRTPHYQERDGGNTSGGGDRSSVRGACWRHPPFFLEQTLKGVHGCAPAATARAWTGAWLLTATTVPCLLLANNGGRWLKEAEKTRPHGRTRSKRLQHTPYCSRCPSISTTRSLSAFTAASYDIVLSTCNGHAI